MPSAEPAIAAVRRFTRFYTRQIALLNEGLLDTPYTLAEARVLYELAHRGPVAARDIGGDLGLDAGYLSRILKGFETSGLLSRTAATDDARRAMLTLTEAGQAAFAPLDRASAEQVERLLSPLSKPARDELVVAMAAIERCFGARAHDVSLRPHRIGDMGWITSRQAALYAAEYGWNDEFEALVAEITASFLRSFDPARERCWVADRDGEILGSVFLVRADDTLAKLRLLYVEPEARGLGVGARLVDACIAFAREAGYATVTLWTNDILSAARRIYQRAGFVLVEEENHHSFGHDLVGQNWTLDLRS